MPLTFRSGGTILSGQAVTDGVLVDVRRNFRDVEVLDDGARVRVQPGVTVRALNARLARYGRKFGPDPASEAACTIGGVVANNSSGMNCGTVDNTYRTLESLTVVLPSGTVIDTGTPDADRKLRALEPELYEGLARLARVVGGSRTLQAREREILGELTDSLAGLIAEDVGAEPGDPEPWLAAHTVLGLYAALLELARHRALAGVCGPGLAEELRARGERGLALLQHGLSGYARRTA